jgi:hypothetical protein
MPADDSERLKRVFEYWRELEEAKARAGKLHAEFEARFGINPDALAMQPPLNREERPQAEIEGPPQINTKGLHPLYGNILKHKQIERIKCLFEQNPDYLFTASEVYLGAKCNSPNSVRTQLSKLLGSGFLLREGVGVYKLNSAAQKKAANDR